MNKNRNTHTRTNYPVTCFQSDCLCRRTNVHWTCQRGFIRAFSVSLLSKLVLFTMSFAPYLLHQPPPAVRWFSRLTFGVNCGFLRRNLSPRATYGDRTSARGYTSAAGSKPVRIGCASGFWGDTATSGTDTARANRAVSFGMLTAGCL